MIFESGRLADLGYGLEVPKISLVGLKIAPLNGQGNYDFYSKFPMKIGSQLEGSLPKLHQSKRTYMHI